MGGGLKGKIPLVAEGKLDVSVGLNDSWAWTDIMTKMRSDIQTMQSTWEAAPGTRTGLSPSGVMVVYRSTYGHKDGRITDKVWSTFDVIVWKPVVYSQIPRNRVDFGAKPAS
ncbi:hypothetical protein [Streptomyces sp. NPDC059979]|uniref:hypothetical protein n=1 Tax=Streptomyces sp. NPDC059979 TaxID=3347021 RepID=UPI0036A84C0A